MGDRTLCDRETIPPVFKTIPSSSLVVGESVFSVYVSGNDTTDWDDKERYQNWQKTRGGTLYPGDLSDINHDKEIVNVDFDDGDKSVGVPFNLTLQDRVQVAPLSRTPHVCRATEISRTGQDFFWGTNK